MENIQHSTFNAEHPTNAPLGRHWGLGVPLVSRKSSVFACLWFLSSLLAAAAQPTNAPAWPPPPADPYIVYVRTIAGAKDIGAKAPFFTRLANAITGVTSDSQKFSRPFGLSLDDDGNLAVT